MKYHQKHNDIYIVGILLLFFFFIYNHHTLIIIVIIIIITCKIKNNIYIYIFTNTYIYNKTKRVFI